MIEFKPLQLKKIKELKNLIKLVSAPHLKNHAPALIINKSQILLNIFSVIFAEVLKVTHKETQ